jgi:hypothetical protein
MRITKGKLAVAELAGAAFLAWVPMSGTAVAASSGTTGAVPAAASEAGTLNCSQLESLWEQAGGAPSAAFTAAEIATAESSGQQYATDNDGNGSTDRGYWQINSTNPGSSYDPITNAREAVSLSGDGTSWQPWVTFQTGAYAGKC